MAKARSKDTEFHIKLENIQLDQKSIKRIEGKLQNVIMSELVGYTPDPDKPYPPVKGPFPGPLVVLPPKDWFGLRLRRLLNSELSKFDGPGIKQTLDKVVKNGPRR